MGKEKTFLGCFSMDGDLELDLHPGHPLVEISENRRVLIENHQGVKNYSQELIVVNMRFGCVHISGCGLEMLKMSKDQLVILGEIKAVTLLKRKMG